MKTLRETDSVVSKKLVKMKSTINEENAINVLATITTNTRVNTRQIA